MIRFLKNIQNVPINKEYRCGDGCCSSWEPDGEDSFSEGEEVWDCQVDLSNLEEGTDYEWI